MHCAEQGSVGAAFPCRQGHAPFSINSVRWLAGKLFVSNLVAFLPG